jgi:hypothetical protein
MDLRLISGARSSGAFELLTWEADRCATAVPGRRKNEGTFLAMCWELQERFVRSNG